MYSQRGAGSAYDNTEVKWRIVQKGQSRKSKAGGEKRETQEPRQGKVCRKRQENKQREREKFLFQGGFANRLRLL